ncbi:MAG: hypothetical protein Kow00106_17460 [Anaerolineae bacterium]
MHSLLFENQRNLDLDDLIAYAELLDLDLQRFSSCLDGEYSGEINHDIGDALTYRVQTVPTFFVNGQRVEGANPDSLRSAIETALREAE